MASDTKEYSIFDEEVFSKVTWNIKVSQLMKMKQVTAPSST